MTDVNMPAAPHTDIIEQSLLIRTLPKGLRPYAKLARLDRPIGTWLLLFPCWWSFAMASDGLPEIWGLLLFAFGALVMRGAGCTVNDLADKDFDAKVERTANRPIPAGEVSVKQAFAFLGLQLLVGLIIVLFFNWTAIGVAVLALPLVAAYPFMKRITWWPQAFLGLTFNWGALVGWAAVTGEVGLPAILLYIGGLFWTLGYDTIYAHQDKEDDQLIGVKSSALRLGANTVPAVLLFYALALCLMVTAGALAGLGALFIGTAIILGGFQLVWQVASVDIDDAKNCLMRFKSNRFFGWTILLAILLEKGLAL